MLDTLADLIRAANAEIADLLQSISLFHYFDGGDVMNAIINNNAFPLGDFVLMLAIGILALIGSLILFHRRKLA
jgi:hypothetical protein